MASPQTPMPQQPNQQPPTPTSFGPPTTPGRGPASPVGSAPKPPRALGGLVVVTLVVSVLAVVIAVAGVVISAIALGRSGDATDVANEANSRAMPTEAQPLPPPNDPTAEDVGQPTVPGPTTSPTDISPTAQFAIAYEGQHLRVRSVSCNYLDQTFTDLDEPRVAGTDEANTEFGYAGCDPGTLNIGLPFARVSGPEATPKDCLETIRTDPGRSPIAPTGGMTLCLVTDQNAAAAQGFRQKLVFITVDSLSVDNNVGVLNITVKAWTAPQ